MSNILFKCAHEITIQTPLCLMAEWAKKLCEGLSCQINISIPLSAALSMYNDVTTPSVKLWEEMHFHSKNNHSNLAACILRCEMDFWIHLHVHWLMYKLIKQCLIIVPDYHGYTFNNDWQRTVVMFFDLYKSACSFHVHLSKNSLFKSMEIMCTVVPKGNTGWLQLDLNYLNETMP